ncbi:MAG: pyruvate kinase [Spirochaetes bacterium]|nr:pyruvate kinase [Spirochaetota bacterium]
MKVNQKKIDYIDNKIEAIIKKAEDLEKKYNRKINKVNAIYKSSALNLIHYMALRSFDIEKLQEELKDAGLASLAHCENHVMKTLFSVKTVVSSLKKGSKKEIRKDVTSAAKSMEILDKNTKIIFGSPPAKRRTRIMVTIPGEAADDYKFIYNLLKTGMNSARINCAHDNPDVWKKIIDHIKKASVSLNKNCSIMMDISGPKIRTGAITPGPKVMRIKPQKNSLGKVIAPARIWLAPPGVTPPGITPPDFVIPVSECFLKKIKRGSILNYTDSRGKKGTIFITNKQGDGKWGISRKSAYFTTDTKLFIENYENNNSESGTIGELDSTEEFLLLKTGDTLILHADQRVGEAAIYDETGTLVSPAHISCTFPEIFDYAKPGEDIFFDDGKIEGVIESVTKDEITVKIINAKNNGSRLRADKGINFPSTKFKSFNFSDKDKHDIEFIAKHADVINYSFVNNSQDIDNLIKELKKHDSKIGIIVKIETESSFRNLPDILLSAMKTFPVGVMLARGDLAIETGWKNFATIQEEIMRICSAAHIPVVWATQVLEQLAKTGVPTRAEITDTAMAHKAECVMLNKGIYINQALKMLDKILIRMEKFQHRRETILPLLNEADKLEISHEKYNV